MNTKNHLKTVRVSRAPVWALFGILLLFCAVPAHALLVTVDLGWGYPGGGSLADYNLQEGSIVQVLMYNSANASAPGPDASDNFPADSYGTYTGDGIAAEPYPGTEPANVPTDNNIYSPLAMPDGHVIAYTTQIGEAVDGWWHIYAQFEILGTYDRLYIRVFGATEFPSGNVWASYWGISDVQVGTNIVDTWYVDPIVDVSAPNANYFEVIPEPSTMALFLLGGTGLWTGVRRRKKVG